MQREYTNKNVVVTGSFSGIGRAVATAYASEGANVFLVDANPRIEEASEAIAAQTQAKVTAIHCDISDANHVERAFSDIERIDVLIANAGIEAATPIDGPMNVYLEKFKRISEVNITGTYLTIAFARQRMAAGSSIVITSSIWGKTAVPDFAAYNASKHANLGLMRTLAKELGPHGIRVNAVCPGWVKTGPAMESLRILANEKNCSEEALLKELSEEQCFGEVQSPEDVAFAYLMLTSKYSINVTGQAINADRGALLT
ncbi:SDR family oxidoreductase [uncultured Pseudoteredinibacter sp.]|uniref:SDR family NAD(P)-dependent oxidoreductase n=1 Tax=uncultured Pseudoteredinibacter sp. TaxID=1641701 RepID=UPI00262E3762|nr:SDR family oxidoreductase [uncultured Pseudoteredinibacter sp.]